jgi:hypothetical protein
VTWIFDPAARLGQAGAANRLQTGEAMIGG